MQKRDIQRYLNMQADRIEAVCRENGLLVRVSDGVVGPRLTVLNLQVSSNDANLVGRLRKLEETLALRLGQSRVQVSRSEGQLVLLFPRPGDPRPVWLEQQYHDRRPPKPHTMLLGLPSNSPERDPQPLALLVIDTDINHVLISGASGLSGKTVLLKTMILSLAYATPPDKARMTLIDPKGREFSSLERLPHVDTLVRGDTVAAAEVLAELVVEMRQRQDAGVKKPRLYVFIDELHSLLGKGGAAIANPLIELANRGRDAGIHLIAGTQRTSDIPNSLALNFSVRIVGAVATKNKKAALAVSSFGQSGAESLLGRGDFLLFGKTEARFQAAMPRDIDLFVDRIVNVYAPAVPLSSPRQWVYEEEQISSIKKLLSFPGAKNKDAGGRGGHNADPFTPAQIADAQSGLTAHYLRKKHPDLSGSRASRLEREYGPPKAERKASLL